MIRDKIEKLIRLAFDVSTNTEDDVFVYYSPHCNLVTVRVYEGGWIEDKDSDLYFNQYYDVTSYRTIESICEEFDKIIEQLELKLLPQSC